MATGKAWGLASSLWEALLALVAGGGPVEATAPMNRDYYRPSPSPHRKAEVQKPTGSAGKNSPVRKFSTIWAHPVCMPLHACIACMVLYSLAQAIECMHAVHACGVDPLDLAALSDTAQQHGHGQEGEGER